MKTIKILQIENKELIDIKKTDIPYVKVPNTFIRYKNTDLIQSTDIQFKLFLYIYFSSSLGIFETCIFSIEHLLRMTGVRRELKHIKRNSKYADLLGALNWFTENGYILPPDKPFEEYDVRDIITIHYLGEDLPIEGYLPNGKFQIKEQFTKITRYEFGSLTYFNESSNSLLDLFIYAYIKSLIIHRRDKYTIEEKPECCYLTYETIATACDVSRNTAVKSVQRLSDLKLIAFEKPDNIEKFKDQRGLRVAAGKFSNMKTVYVLRNSEFEQELECGIEKYIKSNQKQFKYI